MEKTKCGCFLEPAQQPQKPPENDDDVLHQLLCAVGNYRSLCFAAFLSLANQWSSKDTKLENTGFKSFPVQFYFLPLPLFLKILKHQALQVSWFHINIY